MGKERLLRRTDRKRAHQNPIMICTSKLLKRGEHARSLLFSVSSLSQCPVSSFSLVALWWLSTFILSLKGCRKDCRGSKGKSIFSNLNTTEDCCSKYYSFVKAHGLLLSRYKCVHNIGEPNLSAFHVLMEAGPEPMAEADRWEGSSTRVIWSFFYKICKLWRVGWGTFI